MAAGTRLFEEAGVEQEVEAAFDIPSVERVPIVRQPESMDALKGVLGAAVIEDVAQDPERREARRRRQSRRIDRI